MEIISKSFEGFFWENANYNENQKHDLFLNENGKHIRIGTAFVECYAHRKIWEIYFENSEKIRKDVVSEMKLLSFRISGNSHLHKLFSAYSLYFKSLRKVDKSKIFSFEYFSEIQFSFSNRKYSYFIKYILGLDFNGYSYSSFENIISASPPLSSIVTSLYLKYFVISKQSIIL